jgi:hypothetical protein
MDQKTISDYCLMVCASFICGMLLIFNYFTTNEIASSVYIFGIMCVMCWYIFMSNFVEVMQQIIDLLKSNKGD